MINKGIVLIAAPVHPVLTDALIAEGYALRYAEAVTQQTAAELIKDCVGVVTSTRLLLDQSLLDAAPHLKWIGRMGSGMEVIDVPYATSKGIACFSSPEGNSNAVGEHALGMLLSLTKKISSSHAEVKEGKWIRDANRGIELEGMKVGIIGYGHTGQAFANKLRGFDVAVLAYDKYHPIRRTNRITVCQELTPIFETADIISFHVPLNADTKHYCDRTFIQNMQRPFIIINTSRGEVVDTAALYEGLLEGKISGVCLDVLEGEPLQNMNEDQRRIVENMLHMPQVIITPHIAGYSHNALYKMSNILLDRILGQTHIN